MPFHGERQDLALMPCFDALQSAMDSIRNRSITISTEGPESQAAQYKGFIDGKANFNNAWKDLDIMF